MDRHLQLHRLKPDQVVAQLGSRYSGLTLAEAEKRLRLEGENILRQSRAASPAAVLRQDVVFLALLVCAVVSVGVQHYVAAIALIAAAGVHGAATLAGARQKHRFLQYIQRHLSAQVTVLRGNKRLQIPARELVQGDIVCLDGQERIAADLRVLEAQNLVVDQSDITGNAELLRKSASAARATAAPFMQRNMLYAGSQTISGTGRAIVVARANDTALARQALVTHQVLATSSIGFVGLRRSWILPSTVTTVVVLAIFANLAHVSLHDFLSLLVVLAVAALPTARTVELYGLHTSQDLHREAALLGAQRSALGDVATKLGLTFIGIMCYFAFAVPLASTAVLLLVFDFLVQIFPVSALSWDRHPESVASSIYRPHNVFGFGILAGGLAYVNYVLFFARQGVALPYMNTASPLYAQAITLALLTIALCQFINLLFVRAHRHDEFLTEFLWSNKKLFGGFTAGLAVLCLATYIPVAQTWLHTGALSATDWSFAVVATALYAGAHFMQRHTRKHTRHAILQLHKKVNQLA